MKVRFRIGACVATLLTTLAACGGSDDPAPTPIPQLSAATAGTIAYCSELTTRAAFANTAIGAASAVVAGTLTVAGTPVRAHCLVTGKMNQRTSPVDTGPHTPSTSRCVCRTTGTGAFSTRPMAESMAMSSPPPAV